MAKSKRGQKASERDAAHKTVADTLRQLDAPQPSLAERVAKQIQDRTDRIILDAQPKIEPFSTPLLDAMSEHPFGVTSSRASRMSTDQQPGIEELLEMMDMARGGYVPPEPDEAMRHRINQIFRLPLEVAEGNRNAQPNYAWNFSREMLQWDSIGDARVRPEHAAAMPVPTPKPVLRSVELDGTPVFRVGDVVMPATGGRNARVVERIEDRGLGDVLIFSDGTSHNPVLFKIAPEVIDPEDAGALGPTADFLEENGFVDGAAILRQVAKLLEIANRVRHVPTAGQIRDIRLGNFERYRAMGVVPESQWPEPVRQFGGTITGTYDPETLDALRGITPPEIRVTPRLVAGKSAIPVVYGEVVLGGHVPEPYSIQSVPANPDAIMRLDDLSEIVVEPSRDNSGHLIPDHLIEEMRAAGHGHSDREIFDPDPARMRVVIDSASGELRILDDQAEIADDADSPV